MQTSVMLCPAAWEKIIDFLMLSFKAAEELLENQGVSGSALLGTQRRTGTPAWGVRSEASPSCVVQSEPKTNNLNAQNLKLFSKSLSCY